AVNTAVGFRRGEGREVEAQALQRLLERAQPGGRALELIEESLGLSDEMCVAIGHRNVVPDPILGSIEKDSPALAVNLDAHAAAEGVELQASLVGGLKLVEAVVHQNVAMPGADVNGVLDLDFRQGLVGAVAEQA